MTTRSSFDQETFQKLLASAYVIQEYLENQKAKRTVTTQPVKSALSGFQEEFFPAVPRSTRTEDSELEPDAEYACDEEIVSPWFGILKHGAEAGERPSAVTNLSSNAPLLAPPAAARPLGEASRTPVEANRVGWQAHHWATAGMSVLAIVGWIALFLTDRRVISNAPHSLKAKPSAIEQAVSSAPLQPMLSNKAFQSRTAPIQAQDKNKPRIRWQRLPSRNDEADLVAENVTVRYFTRRSDITPPRQAVRSEAQSLPSRGSPIVGRVADPPDNPQAGFPDNQEIKPAPAAEGKCGRGHLGKRVACLLHKLCPVRKISS